MNRPILAVSLLTLSSFAAAQTTVPAAVDSEAAGSPTTQLSVDVGDAGFDPAEHLFGDAFGSRKWLFDHGILIDSNLIVDWNDNLMGGLNTHSNIYHERFNLTFTGDTKKLFNLEGGTIFAAYQLQHGPHASNTLIGDAQNINSNTDADGRSQLGQLFYQQKIGDFRFKAGKVDGNSDFDVMDNGGEFLNNSFSTTPTLYLMPSFPDNGMGAMVFYEPEDGPLKGYYAGVGLFDGSIARGYRIGEYGPGHYLEDGDDLMPMLEVGKRYDLDVDGNSLPGKIAVGGWFNTNEFARTSGTGTVHGTGGGYLDFEQILWKFEPQKPVTAGPPGLDQTETSAQVEYSKSIALTSTLSWADPDAIATDVNGLAGLTFVGFVPTRPIDAFGVGVTSVHFARGLDTRDDFETTFETFYRIRFTRWVSLKPDLQYIQHPFGAGAAGDDLRSNALALTLRLEMSF